MYSDVACYNNYFDSKVRGLGCESEVVVVLKSSSLIPWLKELEYSESE
jgi:hypothetical protein